MSAQQSPMHRSEPPARRSSARSTAAQPNHAVSPPNETVAPANETAPPVDGDWERRLMQRRVLPLRPQAAIAIKRDTHSFEINAPAGDFARGFAAVMADPTRRFGLIQVERPSARRGRPFQVGDRFQGRFNLPRAVQQQWGLALPRVVRARRLTEQPTLQHSIRRIEETWTSDFGQITELQLVQQPYRVQYVYLEGSCIAGSSTFEVVDTGPGRCRLTQVFEYQELHALYVLWLGLDVLKLHAAVVYSQAAQAAQSIGSQILNTSIPKEYTELAAVRP
jgi:hypothetical protein